MAETKRGTEMQKGSRVLLVTKSAEFKRRVLDAIDHPGTEIAEAWDLLSFIQMVLFSGGFSLAVLDEDAGLLCVRCLARLLEFFGVRVVVVKTSEHVASVIQAF